MQLTSEDFQNVHRACRQQYRAALEAIEGRAVGLPQVLAPMALQVGAIPPDQLGL